MGVLLLLFVVDCLWFVFFGLGYLVLVLVGLFWFVWFFSLFLTTHNKTFFGEEKEKKPLLNGALCGRIV